MRVSVNDEALVPRWADRAFDSYPEFYADVYAHAIVAQRQGRNRAVSVLQCNQAPGDWSDAATPDLVVCRLDTGAARATVDLGAGRFGGTLYRGGFLLGPPGCESRILVEDAHRISLVAINYGDLVTLAPGDSELPPDGDFGGLHGRFLRDPHVIALIDALWVAMDPRRDGSGLLVDGLLLQMAGRLQDLAHRDDTRAPKGGLAPWQARRAVEYLAARLDTDVRLADLAAEVGLSPFHFARAFRASVGEPPHRHHVRLRIEAARRLLTTTSRPVIDIALDCGFGAPQAFARAFRRLTGTSPSEYRQAGGMGRLPAGDAQAKT